jgi:predicted O-methyltransferase YrrM
MNGLGALRKNISDSPMSRNSAVEKPLAQARRLDKKLPRIFIGGLRTSRRWGRFVLRGQRLAVPELVDFICGNHVFYAIQIPSELTALGEILVERRPERALEIGTARGGTLLFLTRLASPNATIVSVDLPDGKFGGYSARRGWFYQRFARRSQRLHLLQGDSHSDDMLSRVKSAFGGQPLDYLFIDGDHSYEGVKQDFELYAPLVRNGGVIALHDVAEHAPEMECEVSRLWNQIKSRYRHREIIEKPSQGWGGMGVLYVD